MRICKHCGIDDDHLKSGVYWVRDNECSGCVQEVVQPLNGSNDEYAGERPHLAPIIQPRILKQINGRKPGKQ